MKSVISTTYDDLYLFSLPIVVWCWNKLNVDVICFIPIENQPLLSAKSALIDNTLKIINAGISIHKFNCPEHKEATYSQCSRLYASALDLPEDEILITSDVDMCLFVNPANEIPKEYPYFYVFGYDLTPENQYPMCYIWARQATWKSAFGCNTTYQHKLDTLLSHIEAEHFRGNYWGKDQEEAYNIIKQTMPILIPRARPGTQFSSKRYDRDDAYLLDRLSPDTIDFHLPRPGYEEKNFEIIMTVLKYHYPDENFDWLISYREQYIKLL
jgi:hypothetical protein